MAAESPVLSVSFLCFLVFVVLGVFVGYFRAMHGLFGFPRYQASPPASPGNTRAFRCFFGIVGAFRVFSFASALLFFLVPLGEALGVQLRFADKE